MATAVITEKKSGIAKKIEKKQTRSVKFTTNNRISLIEEILPFRIRFTAIQIPSLSPTNIPAIPLQVIGYSNYIL